MARRKRHYVEPTPEQLATLIAYVAWCRSIGVDDWKSQLSLDWMRAGSRFDGSWAHLQQLRNSNGPSWLASYELPEE